MDKRDKTQITVNAEVNAPVEKVWKMWTTPGDIVRWNNASDDWHSFNAENDLRAGGKFKCRMEAKDGSSGFDFEGVYNEVRKNEFISYTLGDNRKVEIFFEPKGEVTAVTETFEAENTFPLEMQRSGWQAILDNFKKYAESD